MKLKYEMEAIEIIEAHPLYFFDSLPIRLMWVETTFTVMIFFMRWYQFELLKYYYFSIAILWPLHPIFCCFSSFQSIPMVLDCGYHCCHLSVHHPLQNFYQRDFLNLFRKPVLMVGRLEDFMRSLLVTIWESD